MSMDHGLNRLYTEYFSGGFQPIAMPLPSEVGNGTIAQAVTNHGIVVSEWDVKYHDTITVTGESKEDHVQFLFCMKDGVSWQMDGNRNEFILATAEVCAYRGTGQAEHLCYRGQSEYDFKSLKIPVRYLGKMLEEYFEPERVEIYQHTLFDEFSKVTISPYIEHIFSEIQGVNGYVGGFRRLFLDSKIQELLAVILSEILEIEHSEQLSPSLGKSDMEAIKNAKLIIDSNLAFAPDTGQLSRLVGMSLSKLSKGFSALYGMPIHAYIIDRRLEKAAQLLMDGGYTVTQVAIAIGYYKPSM